MFSIILLSISFYIIVLAIIHFYKFEEFSILFNLFFIIGIIISLIQLNYRDIVISLIFIGLFFIVKFILKLNEYIGIFILSFIIYFSTNFYGNNENLTIELTLILSLINTILVLITLYKDKVVLLFSPKEYKIIHSILSEIENEYSNKYKNSIDYYNPYLIFTQYIKPIFYLRIKNTDKYKVLTLINDFKGSIRGFVYKEILDISSAKILGDCNIGNGILDERGEIFINIYDDFNNRLLQLNIINEKELKHNKENLLNLLNNNI